MNVLPFPLKDFFFAFFPLIGSSLVGVIGSAIRLITARPARERFCDWWLHHVKLIDLLRRPRDSSLSFCRHFKVGWGVRKVDWETLSLCLHGTLGSVPSASTSQLWNYALCHIGLVSNLFTLHVEFNLKRYRGKIQTKITWLFRVCCCFHSSAPFYFFRL